MSLKRALAKYKLIRTKTFIKEYKKLNSKLQDSIDEVLRKVEKGDKKF
ncbi:hypothetical protein Cjcuy013_03130 [Campylobacter jejuni]|nr:hypothetical protein [Campylobacter jejuni]MBC5860705.1 hypothetical protein [Campylobacter jejuni]